MLDDASEVVQQLRRADGVGVVARERAPWPARPGVAGFFPTVRFEYRGWPDLRSLRRRAMAGTPTIERRRYGPRRKRLFRHQARGGLSQPLAPHVGRLPRERRRSSLPPIRQPGALSQGGPRRLCGAVPGNDDGGGGPPRRAVRQLQGTLLLRVPPVPPSGTDPVLVEELRSPEAIRQRSSSESAKPSSNSDCMSILTHSSTNGRTYPPNVWIQVASELHLALHKRFSVVPV